ncbi:MAG TPA: G1 family glutamic endopeptidase [Acidimicrobiales bacterium]|nr:G1 family glutamic endopeptidase [Acidimicrobiales bacterium]
MGHRLLRTLVLPVLVTGMGVVAATVASSGTPSWASARHLPTEYHAVRVPGPRPTGIEATTFDQQWSSRNWSGYAITGATYTTVSGSWQVPTVNPPTTHHKSRYSATWVGIDGFKPRDDNLIQAGTEQDWMDGAAFYRAWWEILPAAETPISSITVHPGDTMAVTITQGSPDWTITVTDSTTGQSFTTTQRYRGDLSSAEWIQEAPTVGRRIAKLADDSTFAFDDGTADNANPELTFSDSGVMVNKNGAVISSPSAPDLDTDGFAVAHGSTAPLPPSS